MPHIETHLTLIVPLRVGCDLVSISRFRDRLVEGGTGFLEKILLPAEYVGQPIERLAGTFAAKEAVCKALSLPPGHWLDIGIEHETSGAPKIVLLGTFPDVKAISVSISHDGDYALAFVVAQIGE